MEADHPPRNKMQGPAQVKKGLQDKPPHPAPARTPRRPRKREKGPSDSGSQ